MTVSTPKIVYRFKDGVYINLTNRCPNLCTFCIKTKWHLDFHGNNLDLQGQEPSAQAVVGALERELAQGPFQEVVFCGYGEPTMRLDVLLFTAHILRGWRAQAKYPPFTIRLNTNGLGNVIHHRNIVPDLHTAVDEINVSVNAATPQEWRKLVCPAPGYEDGFESVWDFLQQCVAAGFEKVVASCVDGVGADTAAVEKKALAAGASFYLRSFLDGND